MKQTLEKRQTGLIQSFCFFASIQLFGTHFMSSVYCRRLRVCQRERRLERDVVGGLRINSKSGFLGLYQRGHLLALQISSVFSCTLF